jgi:hypothetical protein
VRIKLGNMNLSFAGFPPLTKADEKTWGHCTSLGNGEIMIWLNPMTAVDDKWLETLIHELIHAVEHAAGKRIPHSLVKMLAVYTTRALIDAGLVDPAEIRKRFEAGTDGPTAIWDGEKSE